MIHCRSSRSGTAARLGCAPQQAQHWDRGYCVGERDASRRRERVTARRFAPNSLLEAHRTRFQQWSRTMLTKHLLAISLVLPLVAVSATAQAGSTISDKSYWPSEARQNVQARTV